MQTLLRTEFGGKTVLTIAHRLVTVCDYDAILVMGGGKLVEAGSPAELLARPHGALAAMARALGDKGEAALMERASGARVRASSDAMPIRLVAPSGEGGQVLSADRRSLKL